MTAGPAPRHSSVPRDRAPRPRIAPREAARKPSWRLSRGQRKKSAVGRRLHGRSPKHAPGRLPSARRGKTLAGHEGNGCRRRDRVTVHRMSGRGSPASGRAGAASGRSLQCCGPERVRGLVEHLCSADKIGMKQVSERVRGFAQGLVPRPVSPRELHGHARGCPIQVFCCDGPRLSVCRASVATG
jgi:hypothetical protein